MSGRGTVWSPNYPVGELSGRRNVDCGNVSRETACLGNCSDTDDEQVNIFSKPIFNNMGSIIYHTKKVALVVNHPK